MARLPGRQRTLTEPAPLVKADRPATGGITIDKPPGTVAGRVDVRDRKAPAKRLPEANPKIVKPAAVVVGEDEQDDWFLRTFADDFPETAPFVAKAIEPMELLSGPRNRHALPLHPRLRTIVAGVVSDLSAPGHRVTRGEVIAHALAYALEHQDEWLRYAAPNGRRSGQRGITVQASGFRLPDVLLAYVDALVDGLAAGGDEDAPSRKSVITAGLGWALQKQTIPQWKERVFRYPISG